MPSVSIFLHLSCMSVVVFMCILFLPTEQARVSLSYTPDEITAALTRNVTVRCEKGASSVGASDSMRWFRIAKKSTDGWINVVEYTAGGSVTNMTGVTAAGYLSPIDWSGVLQATWAEATDDTIGTFRCEFFGITSQSGYDVDYSYEETIEETMNADTLSKVWEGLNVENKQLASCPAYSSKFKNKMSTLGRHLDQHYNDVHETSWKHESYSLLMPETGCPAPFMNESNSYLKFHEESSSKSSNEPCLQRNEFFHLSKPVGEKVDSNCFVNLRFCESKEQRVEVPWPDGQYCINRLYYNSCPPGFTPGYLRLDAEDTGHSSERSGDTVYHYSKQYYCCKNSASHYTPMVMPTEKPFYLYRYGGACQMILGMGVTEEFIDIDTERSGYNNYVEYDHPDIDSDRPNPVVIHLCYYSKNDSY